ncbi:MAG: hypothetical protein CBD18_02430 [Opitutales bacterium TMED158]|nr:MAG: hypothetical protein CBD18_02430 [Opitutales bacterium TMED158]
MGRRIKQTKAGKFLREKAPEVAGVVGELLPDRGALGVVKRLLLREGVDPGVVQEFEALAQSETTRRWKSDNSSHVLAKIVRPLVVLLMTVVMLCLAIADSAISTFEVRDAWASLLEVVWLSAVAGYFGLRTAEKLRD